MLELLSMNNETSNCESCPLRQIATEKQQIYDIQHAMLFGSEDKPGVASNFMLQESKIQDSPLADHTEIKDLLGQFRASLANLMDTIASIEPPHYDYDALAQGCSGPVENQEGLAYGFPATSRCGSLAIGEDARVEYTLITQRPPETE